MAIVIRGLLNFGAAFATLWFAGCSTLPAAPPRSDQLDCSALYARYDAAVEAAGVRDAQTTHLPRYPYLRVDRLHAALREAAAEAPVFDAWLADLLQLGREARSIELANLPQSRLAALQPLAEPSGAGDLTQRLDECAEQLKRRELRDPAQRAQLLAAAQVPDDYSSLARAVGLYPIAAIAFARGVNKMHEEMHALYANGAALARDASVVAYSSAHPASMSAAEVAALLQRASINPLHIPRPTQAETLALFAAFAPVLQVRTLSDDDRIGAAAWDAHGEIHIDTARPVVYQLLSHTRVGSETLLQLNYIFWFPARPRTGKFDLLGGKLDGLVWRVTLARDGSALLYDSIHNCGCYHQFFPTERLTAKPAAACDEGAFVPAAAPIVAAGQRIMLGIDANTHFLFRVTAGPAPANATRYTFEPYDALRSLPRADGSRRSLFGPNGIIAGSERGERFLFWPMGIESAGAMRQAGRHATAFIGRRHFDDADLIERYFDLGGTH